MSRASYQARRDSYQKLRIDKLANKHAELTLQLQDADVDVARLKLEVVDLENGQVELTAKLQDSDNEVGRLSMVINRQRKSTQNLVLQKKK